MDVQCRIYIVPLIVFYGAMALPFPLMLALACFAGFLLDVTTAQVLGDRVEISVGWSILLYAVLAAIMHGSSALGEIVRRVGRDREPLCLRQCEAGTGPVEVQPVR